MNKEQQDLAWKCLPNETREAITQSYFHFGNTPNKTIVSELESLFGKHNIVSNTEPKELLFVERERAQNLIKSLKTIDDYTNGIRYCIKTLLGDKCLPDKEPSVQGEPRFHKGDRVRVLTDVWDEVHTVVEVKGIYPQFIYKLSCSTVGWFAESTLEPYTEPETKDNMEEKELNLCEILKGHEGEAFYHTWFGSVKLREVTDEGFIIDDYNYIIPSNGIANEGAELCFFPSKDQRDWNKWLEEQKPKTPKIWGELEKAGKTKVFLSMSNPVVRASNAFIKIHKLIGIGYGGNVSKEDYNNTDILGPICHIGYNHTDSKFFIGRNLSSQHSPILFHTETQAEEFLSYGENISLLKDYFMI